MPSRPTAAIEAGARGLAERVSSRIVSTRIKPYQRVSSRINAYQAVSTRIKEGPSDRACFSRTGASPPAAAAGRTFCLAAAPAAAGNGACMTCMVRTVLTPMS